VALAREAAEALLAQAGPERLVWGSDCPFVGHESAMTFRETLVELAVWAPDARIRRKLSDTALKLYFS
jgi:predicted TIM-barrel fold metal-dependent hydrolase